MDVNSRRVIELQPKIAKSILGYGLSSDSCSGHFTQLRTFLCHDQEWQLEKSRIFLFNYATINLSSPSQDTSSSSKQFVVATDQHYRKRHSLCQELQSNECLVKVCFNRNFFLCTSLKYNEAISQIGIMHSGIYPTQNEYSLWTVVGYITTKQD